MVREHGPVFVVWYSASYTVCWGSVWGVIEFAKVDGVDLLKRIGVERVFDVSGTEALLLLSSAVGCSLVTSDRVASRHESLRN